MIALMILIAKIAYDRGNSRGYSNGIRDARIYKRHKMKKENRHVYDDSNSDDIFNDDPQTVRIVNHRNTSEGYHACSK